MFGIKTYIRIFLVLIVLFLLASVSMAKTVKVSLSGTTENIHAFQEKNITYFSFSELADIIGGSMDWQIIGQEVSFQEDTNKFIFLIDSPYFNRNDSIFNMTYPAKYKNGQIFLPAETFIHFMDQVFYQKISWDKASSTIRFDSEYFNVTDMAVSTKANGLLIEIYLTSALAYDVYITEGNWINITIRGGMLNIPQIQSRLDRRYMYNLKTYQQEGTAQISIRLKRKIKEWHHKLQNDPPRIQISIADTNFEMEPQDSSPHIGPDKKIDVIVIDPGHGGVDYGAIGLRGTREKDVALRIAKDLAKLIRKDKQFKVIMTRDRDKTVSLQQRADIANNASCDLFISIHANSSLKKYVRGWNVFFLAPAKNDSARAVAQFENSAFLRNQARDNNYSSDPDNIENKNPILSILNEMIMTEFQAESQDLAMMIDREFRRKLNITARGVDQAGFFVLNKVYAPSVLIETGFISNKNEEKLLSGKKYQKKVADAIYIAIKKFKAKYENQ